MCELCDIAFKYGTDKCPQIKHHFTEYYHQIFGERRMSVSKVVEIGIGNLAPYYVTGASLFMWREYFPNAHIYGADINPDFLFSDQRISTYLCDQTKRESLIDLMYNVNLIGEAVDLFVDDGLHIPESQLFTCQTVMPLLSDNSIYVIEDAAFVDADVLAKDYRVEVYVPGKRRKYKDDRLVIVRQRV